MVLKDTLAKWTLGLCCPEPVEGSVDDWRGRGGLYYSHSLLGNWTPFPFALEGGRCLSPVALWWCSGCAWGSVVVVVVSGHLGVTGWTSLPWPCEASVEGYFLYNFF